jgi:hypothetical protein
MSNFYSFEPGSELPQLDIPDQCRNCPPIQLLEEDRRSHAKMLTNMKSLSKELMNGMPEEFRQNFIKVNGDVLGAHNLDAGQIIAMIEAGVLQNHGETLNELEEKIKAIGDQILLLTAGCNDGTLKMRAQKGSNIFTASVCASEIIPSECITSVKINRNSI